MFIGFASKDRVMSRQTNGFQSGSLAGVAWRFSLFFGIVPAIIGTTGCGNYASLPENLPVQLKYVIDNRAEFEEGSEDPLTEVRRGTVMDDLRGVGGCWARVLGGTLDREDVLDAAQDETGVKLPASVVIPPFDSSVYWYEVMEFDSSTGVLTRWWMQQYLGFLAGVWGDRGTFEVIGNDRIMAVYSESFLTPDGEEVEGEWNFTFEPDVPFTADWSMTLSGDFVIWFDDPPVDGTAEDAGALFRRFDCAQGNGDSK